MVLGGELIHALIAMDGVKDVTGTSQHTYINIFGDPQVETRSKNEFATHGIKNWHYKPSVYRRYYPTENTLRKENKLPIRVAYEDEMEYKYRPQNSKKLDAYEKK
jgi:hypothetical protein